MRKTTLAVIATCIVASLHFFLAPTFRQAFQVRSPNETTFSTWKLKIRLSGSPDPELDALAKKAEQNHDAEALAYAVVSLAE